MVCEVEASLLAESRVRGCKYSGFGPLCSQIPLTEGIKGRPGGELVWTLLRQHDPRDLSPVYPSRGMKNEFPSIQIFWVQVTRCRCRIPDRPCCRTAWGSHGQLLFSFSMVWGHSWSRWTGIQALAEDGKCRHKGMRPIIEDQIDNSVYPGQPIHHWYGAKTGQTQTQVPSYHHSFDHIFKTKNWEKFTDMQRNFLGHSQLTGCDLQFWLISASHTERPLPAA